MTYRQRERALGIAVVCALAAVVVTDGVVGAVLSGAGLLLTLRFALR